ncbi:MAG: hypothetical protein L6244_04445 [Candidatus Methanoperedenaceae archaeon]|nr:hypothetical protein [Candidatus Methanoperedenaceae archaeon]
MEPGQVRALHGQFELLPLLRIPHPGYLLMQRPVFSQRSLNDLYLRF